MAKVIGIFEEMLDADRAASAIVGAGCAETDVCLIQREQDLERGLGMPPSAFTGIQAQQVPGLDGGGATAPSGAGMGMGQAAGGADTSAASLRKLLRAQGVAEQSVEHLASRVERGGSLLIVQARDEQVDQLQQVLREAGAGGVDVLRG